MLRMPLKRCFIAVCLAVLLSAFVPLQANGELLIDTVLLDYSYSGKIASLEVNVWQDDNSQFRYDYEVLNKSAGLTISYISVGYGPGESIEYYYVPADGVSKVKNVLPVQNLVAGALQITLNPNLQENDSLEFSVVYNQFLYQQNITVRGVVDGSLNTQFRTFTYEKPEPSSPVPEPGTLLLLGSGIMGLGAMARKKLKRREAV